MLIEYDQHKCRSGKITRFFGHFYTRDRVFSGTVGAGRRCLFSLVAMRTMITALLLFGVISSSAQCDYEQNEIDSYTNARKVTSRAKIALNMGTGAWVDFRQVNDAMLLTVRITGGVGSVVIGEGDEIMFKLANDSIVRFASQGIYTPVYQAASTYNVSATYSATREQFAAIAASTVNGFRVYTTSDYLEYSLADKSKWQGRLRDAVTCLLAVRN